MKRQIRRRVFESNSSSTHSISLVSGEDYKRWENGEMYYDRELEELIAKDEAINSIIGSKYNDYTEKDFYNEAKAKEILREEGFLTEEEYVNDEYLETFYDTYTTKNGDKVVAFGKYGYNY